MKKKNLHKKDKFWLTVIENKQSIIIAFLLILISIAFLNPFFVDRELYDSTRIGKIMFFAQYMLYIMPVGIMLIWINRKQTVSYISIGMFLWIVWTYIRGKQGGIWYDEKFFWWAGCFIFYFILEQIVVYTLHKDGFKLIYILAIVVCVVASIEAVMGILQIYEKYKIYHSIFKISGTFFNPAPYAGFLIASLPFAMFLSTLKGKEKIYQLLSIIGYIGVCLDIVVIPVTKSRAAYLGLLASLIVWCFYRYKPIQQLKTILNTQFKRTLVITITPVIVVVFLSGLYLLKKDSASGRLLIWKVVCETIKDNPMTGHGFNSIQATLAPAQAAYFASGQGTESEKMLAGSVKWAFNEFLQTTSELGVLGLLLMLTVITFVLSVKSNKNQRLLTGTSKASVTGILVFGCFSYPFYSLPVSLLFFTALALISGFTEGQRLKISWGKYFYKSISIATILALGIFYICQTPKINRAYLLWGEAIKMYKIQAYSEANESFMQSDKILPNNGLLMQQYSKCLFAQEEYKKAITILENGGGYYKDEFWHITLGDCYLKIGDYRLAEENYKKASQMAPYKFYPEYLLAKLYDVSGQKERAINKANAILDKDIKVDSNAIDEIKEDMRAIINKYTEDNL